MNTVKHHWYRLPRGVRRPIVMIVGSLLILAAGLTGWLPGPGGIPLFLVGIAVLATEFAWAKRVQEVIVGWVEAGGRWLRRHKLFGGVLITAGIAAGVAAAIYFFGRS